MKVNFKNEQEEVGFYRTVGDFVQARLNADEHTHKLSAKDMVDITNNIVEDISWSIKNMSSPSKG